MDARIMVKTLRNGCINGPKGNELPIGP